MLVERRKFLTTLGLASVADVVDAAVPKDEMAVHPLHESALFAIHADRPLSKEQKMRIIEAWDTAFDKRGLKPPILVVIDCGLELSYMPIPTREEQDTAAKLFKL